MKILVTGGAGFIGSHIVDTYLEAGHQVAVLDDLSSGSESNLASGVKLHRVDLRSADGVEAVLAAEKPEVVNHQAARANVRESFEKPAEYAEVNVVGSINLLEACRRHSVRKLIYASTGGAAYGEPQRLPVDEDHSVNPLDPYGASKHHVEHHLFIARHQFGLDYTVLRYPNVYGPRQNPHGEAGVVAIFTGLMLGAGDPVIHGDGEQQRDFLHVSDVARASLLALDRAPGSILNLGSGTPASVNDIFALLAKSTGHAKPARYGPPKAGEVRRIYLDAARATQQLGWSPRIALADGIAQTVAWFQKKR